MKILLIRYTYTYLYLNLNRLSQFLFISERQNTAKRIIFVNNKIDLDYNSYYDFKTYDIV